MKREILIVLILFLSLAGCSTNTGEGMNSPSPSTTTTSSQIPATVSSTPIPTLSPTQKPTEPIESVPEIGDIKKVGNSNNNIYHLGFIAYDDERQYFGAVSGPWLNRYNEGSWTINNYGTDAIRLSADIPIYINIVDDYIYYIKQENFYGNLFGHLIKINKDGSNREVLLKNDCEDMIVIGNWIYFINKEDSSIYKISNDGKFMSKIVSSNCISLQYENSWLYYTIQDVDSKNCTLYKINIQTCGNPVTIKTDFVRTFLLYDGWIYYVNYESNSNSLYKMKEDGSEKTLLYRMVYSFCIKEKIIYFLANCDEHYRVLYKMNLDGSSINKMLDDPKLQLEGIAGIAGEYIYYTFNAGEWTEKARIKNDGSDNKTLRNILEGTDFEKHLKQ